MKAVLLAGGLGERLRPLTNDKPKVMLPIGRKPVLEHNLILLKKANILDIIITLYYKRDAIIDYFKDGRGLGVNIAYAHQENLLGSAGDVKRINTDFKSSFVVIYGDNFSNCDLKSALEYHRQDKQMATIVFFDRERNPNSQIIGGCLRLEPKTNRILEFIEGEDCLTNYVNAGIYILEPEILNYIPLNTFYDFGKDLFPKLLKEGKVLSGYLMPQNEYLFGIDTVDCYEKTNRFYKDKLSEDISYGDLY